MEITYSFDENPQVKTALRKMPSDFLRCTATQTLNFSVPHIPMSNRKNHSGTLRRETLGQGVRGADKDFYLTSNTSYASSVWVMDDATTNWTTPDTHSQWFAYTLKRYGTTIIDNAINQSWKENM